MYLSGLLDRYEWEFIDLRFKIRSFLSGKNINENIVIIDIDDRTLSSSIGQWPFPRSYYGRLVKTLSEDGAKLICFDILFPEEDRMGPENDIAFAEAMKDAGNVILSMEISNQSRDSDLFNEKNTFLEMERAIMPIELLRNAMCATGFVNLSPEPDGICRKSALIMKHQDKTFQALSLSMACAILQLKDIKFSQEKLILTGEKNVIIPLNYENKMYINFQGGFKTFKYISFEEVYKKKYRESNPDFFKNKYVIIGSSAPGLSDIVATPFHHSVPGVEVHATILNSILEDNFLRGSNPLLDLLLIFITGIITLNFRRFNPLRSTIISISIIALIMSISISLFNYKNFILSTVPLLFLVTFNYTGITTHRLFTEERHKRKLRNIFQRYVSTQLVNVIVNDIDNIDLALGGKRKKLTILFSDIRNFTPMSEKLTPEEVVHILNEYLTDMTEIIFKYDGTVDKFMGDCIMAFWGAPIPHEDDALRAVKTAIEMAEQLKVLQKKWEVEGKHSITMGTGINTGEVVVGNIGSPERMEYTVIGDDVNLAQRLESNARGGQIIISLKTYDEVKDKIETNVMTPIKVKGKTEPVAIYEVVGVKKDEKQ